MQIQHCHTLYIVTGRLANSPSGAELPTLSATSTPYQLADLHNPSVLHNHQLLHKHFVLHTALIYIIDCVIPFKMVALYFNSTLKTPYTTLTIQS